MGGRGCWGLHGLGGTGTHNSGVGHNQGRRAFTGCLQVASKGSGHASRILPLVQPWRGVARVHSTHHAIIALLLQSLVVETRIVLLSADHPQVQLPFAATVSLMDGFSGLSDPASLATIVGGITPRSLLLLGGSAADTAQLAAACASKLSKEQTQILQPGTCTAFWGGGTAQLVAACASE